MSNSMYCDNDDIAAVMSEYGLRLASEDTGLTPLEDQVNIDDCRGRASQRIDMYLVKRYDLTTVGNHRWVRQTAAVFAAVCLNKRRGGTVPAELQREYDDLLAELREIRDGQMELDGVAPRAADTPSMSNVRVDMRYRTNKMRVENQISTGRPVSDVERRPDIDGLNGVL